MTTTTARLPKQVHVRREVLRVVFRPQTEKVIDFGVVKASVPEATRASRPTPPAGRALLVHLMLATGRTRHRVRGCGESIAVSPVSAWRDAARHELVDERSHRAQAPPALRRPASACHRFMPSNTEPDPALR